jgi:hypothetical protein
VIAGLVQPREEAISRSVQALQLFGKLKRRRPGDQLVDSRLTFDDLGADTEQFSIDIVKL